MKGSFCESCFKEQGSGGFHHLTKVVMSLPHLTAEVFKEKKYDKDNLRLIKDSVKDCAQSYLFATICEFFSSSFYPDGQALRHDKRKLKHHNNILL